MKNLLLALLLEIPAANRAPMRLAEPAVDALVALAASPEFEPLPFDGTREERVESTLRLMLVWSNYESLMRPNAIGDAGFSLGIMQVSRMFCSRRVLASAYEGYAAGLRVMHLGFKKCGSIVGALNAYATGKCSPRLALVRRRCLIAKVRCDDD